MRMLAMSGFVPEQICDFIRFNGYTGDRNIIHFCGYANDFISQALSDKTIDGVVYPKSCDSSRIIGSYLEGNKYSYQINVPARRDELAVDYFANILRDFRKSLEKIYGTDLESLEKRAKKVNERNIAIAKAYSRLGEISYSKYLKDVHFMMQKPLMKCDFEINEEMKPEIKHRVYLVGSFLSNEDIAEIIESVGLGIVGDNLPESGRIQGRQTEITDDMYISIAREVLGRNPSPTQDDFAPIIDKDLMEIEEKKCDAVIFVTQKYCEPYDFLYSIYQKRLDELNIPSLRIVLNDSEDERKVKLLVEAFADTL